MPHRKISYSGISASTLSLLWRNWALAFGALVLPVVAGMFLPRLITPFVVLGMAAAAGMLARAEATAPAHGCTLTLRTARTALIISGIIMLIINILKSEHLYAYWFDAKGFNLNMPFISGIVIFPVTAIVALVSLLSFRSSYMARQHRHPSGVLVGDSTLGTYIYHEARHQLTLLLTLTGVLAIVNSWYWWVYYIDVNFNSPDYFFFLVLPLATYVISLVFTKMRYTQVGVLLQTIDDGRLLDRDTTILRFLAICGDRMLLIPDHSGKWDTPYEFELHHSPMRTPLPEAEQLIQQKTGRSDIEIKYFYTNSSTGTGLHFEHYAAFIPEPADDAPDGARWLSLDMIERYLHEGSLTPMLMNEIYRIFTITMAWKTYDRHGNRLYPIKNYRPTFRLRDMRQWDVDYDDTSWLKVAADNEDRRFYHLRRACRRLIPRKKST